MSNSTTTRPKRSGMPRWMKWTLGGSVLVVVLGALAVWWFLRDDAPKAVSLDAAVGAVSDGSAVPTGGVAGNWTVDTSVGEFSFENSTGTFVGFRVA